jgi:hypothetical protein
MKWIFYYFLSHIMATQMIPSLCIPHVDSRFSAEIISDTFKTIIHLQNPSPQIGLCAWGGTAPP